MSNNYSRNRSMTVKHHDESVEQEPTFESLYDHLQAMDMPGPDCDNKLTLTESWCEKMDVDFKALKPLLNANAARCDCELMLNVAEDHIPMEVYLPLTEKGIKRYHS